MDRFNQFSVKLHVLILVQNTTDVWFQCGHSKKRYSGFINAYNARHVAAHADMNWRTNGKFGFALLLPLL